MTGCKWEVLTTSSLGLTNLLEWLTEHRKTINSLDYWFITKDIKRYKSTARWRDMEWGPKQWSFCPHGVWGSEQWHMEAFWFPELEALQSHLFQFLWRLQYIQWLTKSLAIDDWFNLQPLSAPQESDGTESSNPQFKFGSLSTSSHPYLLSKSRFVSINPAVVERAYCE